MGIFKNYFKGRKKEEYDCGDKLTLNDIYNATIISLVADDRIFVEISPEKVYLLTKKGGCYDGTETYYECFESSLMLSCFKVLTKEQAVELLSQWGTNLKSDG